MYSLAVQDHFMIAHSFQGEVFGPAQKLHGATYEAEVVFHRAGLDADGLVVDIGLAMTALRRVLDGLDYRNLDEMPEFRGQNTTTEFLAREIHGRLSRAVADGELGPHAGGLDSLTVRLRESPRAWAAFAGPLG